jgi:hypothetical protein
MRPPTKAGSFREVALPLNGTSRLTYGVGQCDQVVRGGGWGFELAVVADQFPAAGGGEAAGVRLAQVVGMGLGVGSEGPHNRGRLRIHVRQRRDRQPGAGVAGAAPW